MAWEVDLFHTPMRVDRWREMTRVNFRGLCLPLTEEEGRNEDAALGIG
jgi:hypothetical protein